MNGTHAARHRVMEQQDAAIGGKHRKGKIRYIRDQRVGGKVPLFPEALARVNLRDGQDRGLVNLLGQHRAQGSAPMAPQKRR